MPTNTIAGTRFNLSLSTSVTGPTSSNVATGASINASAIYAAAYGSAVGQAQYSYSATLTVPTGSPVTLDLTALTDPLGATNSFAAVTMLLIQNFSSTPAEILTVGGGTNGFFSNAFSPGIYPNISNTAGGCAAYLNPNGWPISGTNKNILLTVASGTGVAIGVTVFGR